VIGRYVREKNKLELLDQLRKMTKLPAERLKLQDKGEIKIGKDADLVIFNYDTIIDNATFDHPIESPEGMDHVIIDGTLAMDKGKVVNNRLGKSIRRIQN